MEETKRKLLPSFPPNYVTLVQLQERWMKRKDQLKKQNENEDDEQQTEKPEVAAVSVCVESCQSESTEKKKNVRKGKYSEWRKVQAEDHEVKGGRRGRETHAPEQAIVGDVVVADPTVEIEGKFQDMSIDVGGNENSLRPPRNRSFNLVKNGGEGNANRFRYRESQNTKNAKRMVWVKKRDHFGGAPSPNQSY